MHTQTQAYSKGNLEILIKLPVMFSDWEEAEVPEGNSRMQKGNMQTPYTPNVTFVLGNWSLQKIEIPNKGAVIASFEALLGSERQGVELHHLW